MPASGSPLRSLRMTCRDVHRGQRRWTKAKLLKDRLQGLRKGVVSGALDFPVVLETSNLRTCSEFSPSPSQCESSFSATIIFDSSRVEGVNMHGWDDPRLVTPEKNVPLTGINSALMNVPACAHLEEEETVGGIDTDDHHDDGVKTSSFASSKWHDPLSPPSVSTNIEPDPSLRPNCCMGGARALVRR